MTKLGTIRALLAQERGNVVANIDTIIAAEISCPGILDKSIAMGSTALRRTIEIILVLE